MNTTSAARTSSTPTALRVVLGLIFLLFGIGVLAWPQATLTVVATLFGVELVAAGLVKLVLSVSRSDERTGRELAAIVLDVLTIITGVVCFVLPRVVRAAPGPTAFNPLIVWVIALGWVFDGASELVSGVSVDRSARRKLLRLVYGVVTFVAALLVVVLAATGLVATIRVGGILLVLLGVITVVAAIRNEAISHIHPQHA